MPPSVGGVAAASDAHPPSLSLSLSHSLSPLSLALSLSLSHALSHPHASYREVEHDGAGREGVVALQHQSGGLVNLYHTLTNSPQAWAEVLPHLKRTLPLSCKPSISASLSLSLSL